MELDATKKLNFHKYGKINSIFKRADGSTGFKPGQFINELSVPEFGLIREWELYEKIDGTNIRIGYQAPIGGYEAARFIGGRTDKADIPKPLYEKLEALFPLEKLQAVFGESNAILYGEGIGPKIQDGWSKGYMDYDFILFDVVVRGKFQHVRPFSESLDVRCAPCVGTLIHRALPSGRLRDLDGEEEGYDVLCKWMESCVQHVGGLWDIHLCEDFLTPLDKIEGFVLRTELPLFTQSGERMIFKLKVKDQWWDK